MMSDRLRVDTRGGWQCLRIRLFLKTGFQTFECVLHGLCCKTMWAHNLQWASYVYTTVVTPQVDHFDNCPTLSLGGGDDFCLIHLFVSQALQQDTVGAINHNELVESSVTTNCGHTLWVSSALLQDAALESWLCVDDVTWLREWNKFRRVKKNSPMEFSLCYNTLKATNSQRCRIVDTLVQDVGGTRNDQWNSASDIVGKEKKLE